MIERVDPTPSTANKMIIPLIAEAIFNGISFDIDYWNILKVVALIGAIVLVKLYSRGATNTAERQLHSKVVIVTVWLPIYKRVKHTC